MYRYVKRMLILSLLMLSLPTIKAGGEQAPNGYRDQNLYQVPRASSEVKIDGIIEEPAWRDALKLELAYEVRPGENIEPPVQTDMLITYDDKDVLIAFKCYDPEPSKIRARYTDRDNLWADDWVGVMLDTFNDQRRAFEFVVNPFGIQMDAINDDVGGRYDTSWNAIWKSGGRITDEGYEVELAIPFNQLRFQPANGSQVWGVDGFRSYPRTDRHHLGLFPRTRGANSYLAQADKIEGFVGVKPGKNLEIAPTITAIRTDEREDFPDGDLKEEDSQVDVGVTLRWSLTPNVTLNGTVNPDFSQVEADVVKLDINEQFALYYEETRPFFKEGADYFHTSMLNLLHTRTIADPSTAVKLTGRTGHHTYGVFTARDGITNIIIPGSQGSESDSFDMATMTTVGRYRYNFGNSSVIGGMVTSREGSGYYNRVANLDMRYRITPSDNLTVNLAGSDTRYNDEMIELFGIDDPKVSDHAFAFFYSHSARNWFARAEYYDVGEGFRADLGFVPKVNYRRVEAGGDYIWHGDKNRYFNRISIGGDWDYTEEQNGNVLEREYEAWFNYNGPKESECGAGIGTRYYVYESTGFDQVFYWTYFNLRPTGDLFARFSFNGGDWIDFDYVRPATQKIIDTGFDYHLGKHLFIGFSYTYQTLDVDEGRLFTANVPQSRIVFQFNNRMFIRAILQYIDVRRDQSLYEDEVDEVSKDFFSQYMFSYKINPQTVAYIGYSDSNSGTENHALTQKDRTFFIKLGYAWLP
ncbi:DUF5916 domain-containing protein [Acidobacteriota bacterium]